MMDTIDLLNKVRKLEDDILEVILERDQTGLTERFLKEAYEKLVGVELDLIDCVLLENK